MKGCPCPGWLGSAQARWGLPHRCRASMRLPAQNRRLMRVRSRSALAAVRGRGDEKDQALVAASSAGSTTCRLRHQHSPSSSAPTSHDAPYHLTPVELADSIVPKVMVEFLDALSQVDRRRPVSLVGHVAQPLRQGRRALCDLNATRATPFGGRAKIAICLTVNGDQLQFPHGLYLPWGSTAFRSHEAAAGSSEWRRTPL